MTHGKKYKKIKKTSISLGHKNTLAYNIFKYKNYIALSQTRKMAYNKVFIQNKFFLDFCVFFWNML